MAVISENLTEAAKRALSRASKGDLTPIFTNSYIGSVETIRVLQIPSTADNL